MGAWSSGVSVQSARHSRRGSLDAEALGVTGAGESDIVERPGSELAWLYVLDAYEGEGGSVRRDLFSSPEDLSRIYLDNFPNVQSSWVTQGQEIGHRRDPAERTSDDLSRHDGAREIEPDDGIGAGPQ